MATSAKTRPAKSRKTVRPFPNNGEQPAALERVEHPLSLDDPSLFINRELSLLDFQRRVLEEAQDSANPPLDRVMFLSFVGSNVDEFFMVRVAGLKRQIEKGVIESGPDAMTPAEQLRAIRASVIRLNRAAHECWAKELVPALASAGLRIADLADLTEDQRNFANTYFQDTIFPTLTPLAFDPGRPFPHMSNLSLNLAVVLRGADGIEHFARVKIPDTLPQLVPVTVAAKSKSRTKMQVKEQVFIWLEQLVTANLSTLFPGMEILEAHPFHITRDADSDIQDLEAGDLMESVEEGVFQRRFADVVRVEINEAMPASVLEILVTNLELDRDDIYKISGPLSLVRVRGLAKFDRPDLKFPPFVPALPAPLLKDEEEDIFSTIRRGDILFHHPFDSFQPIVGMLQKAAKDPNVLAIKITLYRVGRNAPVVDALLEAAENGKQIAVLLELKARFDEESNIGWARKLEEYGVHVVYGLLGLKVHCKAALIVRKEGDVIRRYAHLSTGNYNSVTAQLYTDIGMLTCDADIGADCSDLFNFLTGYSAKSKYRKLLVAPNSLRNRFEELLEREIDHQKAGRPARLILKMNSLVDRKMIQLLYEASQAGVKVDLLVRGICCLRPGVPGVSDNIHVTSIVGRFLEHSRIFYFLNGGEEEIYLGSADLMPRNLNRRVEVLFPVRDAGLIATLRDDILGTYLKEQAKARHMLPDGKYVRDSNAWKKGALNSQEIFIQRASKRSQK
ncbi:MAG TPA: polyphosphate kinase 1 [Candidatus Binatia bacterium]|nr:polyphosphate kinase 1 [Candidatus Binatia bacterium]